VARHPSGRRARPADADSAATAHLPKVRELSVVQDLPSTGGRRTADETAQFASVGRRRAPETGEIPMSGRRRAPETAATPAVGRRRAPEGVAAPTPAPGVAGRHRAPGAVDTGLVPVTSEAPPAARAERPAPSRGSWTAPEGMEGELLTRPMRLSDHMQSRRPRPGGPLNG
jgi:hypothetical protein